MENTLAKPVLGSFIPEITWKDPESGLTWLHISYDGTYDDFKNKPKVVLYQDLYFIRSSHNSDTFKIYYKQTPKSLIGSIIKA